MGSDSYDRPFFNASGEVIPGFAVMQIDGWAPSQNGLAVFRVRKPNGTGKQFLINGPADVPVASSQHSGMGYGVRAHGHYALFDPELTPILDQELGPVSGKWTLGSGSGFFVDGDVQGSGASPPGQFPPVTSSKRVRVVMQPAAPTDNVIIGKVRSNWSEAAPQFIIFEIQVLDGPDPRNQPGNPDEGITIENVPPAARAIDQFVKARKSKTTGKWFPDSTATATGFIRGNLVNDLRVDQSQATLTVSYAPAGSPAPVGAIVVAVNPTDSFAATPPRYQFAGIAGGNCTAAQMEGDVWVLNDVQPPHRRPV